MRLLIFPPPDWMLNRKWYKLPIIPSRQNQQWADNITTYFLKFSSNLCEAVRLWVLDVAQFHTTLPSQFPQPHETLWIARHCMIKLLNNWSSCLLFLSIKFIMISSCIRNNECDCVDLPFKGCFRAVVGLTHVSLHYQNNARAGPGCILDRPWPAFLQTLPIWYFQRFIGPCSFWWYASIRWFVIVLVVWWVCLLYSPLGEMVMASYSQCPHGIPCDNLHVFYASVIQRLRTSLYIWDF